MGTGSRPAPPTPAARLAINEDDQRVDRWPCGRTTIHRMDPILGDCSLDRLGKRTSEKWRTYPPQVLPAFVAEMDFDPAEQIKDAIRAALAAGDLGYAHKGELGEAFAEFASDRFGWTPTRT